MQCKQKESNRARPLLICIGKNEQEKKNIKAYIWIINWHFPKTVALPMFMHVCKASLGLERDREKPNKRMLQNGKRKKAIKKH